MYDVRFLRYLYDIRFPHKRLHSRKIDSRPVRRVRGLIESSAKLSTRVYYCYRSRSTALVQRIVIRWQCVLSSTYQRRHGQLRIKTYRVPHALHYDAPANRLHASNDRKFTVDSTCEQSVFFDIGPRSNEMILRTCDILSVSSR